MMEMEMDMSREMEIALAMSRQREMSAKDIEDYAFCIRMVNTWNEEALHDLAIYDPPPSDAHALKWRSCKNPNPAFGIAGRVKGIAWTFERDEYTSDDEVGYQVEYDEELVEWMKGLLDELQAYDVESIDVATLLHSEGYLFPFLRDVLSNKHACIRAKAAELITSMVQNRPTSQQLVIEGNGLQLLLHNFTTDLDTTSRTKTLGAISSLIRNNKSGITVFLREKGYAALRNALSSSTYMEVVNLIEYLRRGTLKS